MNERRLLLQDAGQEGKKGGLGEAGLGRKKNYSGVGQLGGFHDYVGSLGSTPSLRELYRSGVEGREERVRRGLGGERAGVKRIPKY